MSRPRPEALSLAESGSNSNSNSNSKEYVSDGLTTPYLPPAESSELLEKPYVRVTSSAAVEDVRIPVLSALPGEHATTRRRDLYLPIIMISSIAGIPILMGVLFYTSLGFQAKHGVFYPNGTYVRPVNEGLWVGDPDSFVTSHFTPLLISSISSTVTAMLSSMVMGLVGYHLALSWLRSSAALTNKNPTPLQYYYLLGLISNASPMAFVRLVLHVAKKAWARWKTTRIKQLGIPKILWMAGSAMLTVLLFNWTIHILDVVLHSRMVSTLIVTPSDNPVAFAAHAAIKSGCDDPINNVCGVVNRTNEASLGGLNQSTAFRVYEHGSHILDRQDSLAFIGPVDLPSDLVLEASTLVASTHCDAYHPHCTVQDTNIHTCWPTLGANTSARPDLYHWNEFVWTKGFNTSSWETRIQTFLTSKGNLSAPPGKVAALSSGSNLNPFTTATFGCFVDNGDIAHSDKNYTYQTPFINWWSYGPQLKKKPYILCSISFCNTTVYDAKYKLSQGVVTLDSSSLTLANSTAAVAVSSAGMLLGSGDTFFYQWGPRFIDDQIQLDLSNAGNSYGNDTAHFSAAWAQAFSNRYLGWSAGMVELADLPAQKLNSELALSIPVSIAYTFTVLHFVYAFAILVLGASCLIIARGDAAYRTDLKSAHQRLSDASSLVQDLAERSLGDEGEDEPEAGEAGAFGSNQLGVKPAVLTLPDSEVRVRLRKKADGRLGLRFQREP